MTLARFPAHASKPIAALAFDYGTQRIGVAYGQSLTGTAQAVTILKAKDGIPDWNEIAQLIAQWQPDVFVVGLPFNMDGSESELVVRATKFANRLQGRFNLPGYGMDERLSSREARTQQAELRQQDHEGKPTRKRAHKKAAIDAIAAQIILENWFAEWRRNNAAGES